MTNDKPRAWDPKPQQCPACGSDLKPGAVPQLRSLTERERVAYWSTLAAVLPLAGLLLLSWQAWGILLAAGLVAVAVVEAVRALHSGVGTVRGAWVVFVVAVTAWGSAAVATASHYLIHHPDTTSGGDLARLALCLVALGATGRRVALGVRRWSAQLRVPQLLVVETQAEAQERGWDGHR